MSNNNDIHTAFGIIGNIISLSLFISPLYTFVKIVRWKSTRGYSPIPYVMTGVNCSLWVFYGMPFITPNALLLQTVNGAGAVLQIIFIIIFFCYLKSRAQRIKLFALVVVAISFYLLVCLCTLMLVKKQKKRQLIAGIISIIFNFGMYASPLAILKKVVTEKSVKYLPLQTSVALLLNGCAWVIYGLFPFDINVTLPNGLGVLLGAFQVVLYLIYYKTTNWDEDDGDKFDQPQSRPSVQKPANASKGMEGTSSNMNLKTPEV